MKNKAMALAIGLIASGGASAADPLFDGSENTYGVGARYSVAFGGATESPLRHSVGLMSGLVRKADAIPALEYRWSGNQAQLRVAGAPLALRQNGDDPYEEDMWGLTDRQLAVSLTVAMTVVLALVITNNVDDDGGTGGTGGTGTTGGG